VSAPTNERLKELREFIRTSKILIYGDASDVADILYLFEELPALRSEVERLREDRFAMYPALKVERDRLKAELDAARPLLEWAERADPSLIAHLTTARNIDKCSSCDEASTLILELADILTDREALRQRKEKEE
jgi:hypothetical protein